MYFALGVLVLLVALNGVWVYLDKGKGELKKGILPFSLLLYEKFIKPGYISSIKLKKAKELTGQDIDEDKLRIEYAKRITLVNLIIMVICVLIIIMTCQNKGEQIIEKPPYYEGSKEMEVLIDIDNSDGKIPDEDKGIISEKVTVTIEPYRMEEKEFEELVEEVKEYIYEELPGENESLEKVTKPLNFFTEYPENEEVVITWIPDEEGYIDSFGSIEEIPKEKEEPVEILAIISCQGYEATIPVNICILNRNLSDVELLEEFLKENIQEQNEAENQKNIKLPKELAGVNISYPEREMDDRIIAIIGLGLSICVVVFFGKDYKERKKAEMIKEKIEGEYPQIVSKLVLLMKAGMSMVKAWRKVALDGCNDRYGKGPVYDMMVLSVREMESGIAISDSLRNFAIRTQSENFLRLVTYIEQNISKGTKEILDILELELLRTSKEKKNEILRMGEKASTKMMFPMMLLLLIVLFLTIIPAILMI